MNYIRQSFSVQFEYKVFFTSGLFDTSNKLLDTFLKESAVTGTLSKIFFVMDEGVAASNAQLLSQIGAYFNRYNTIRLIDDIIVVPGGETAKNDRQYYDQLIEAVDAYGIDRHSYIAAIGGGAVLDLAGYVAAIAHRGVRHIRIPSTVLSQNDSGVGVKNGINYSGKKNFLGTFSPPVAVFNDDILLTTLSDRDWRAGIAEAIKVALIKDADFFYWIEEHVEELTRRNISVMNDL